MKLDEEELFKDIMIRKKIIINIFQNLYK